MASWTISGVEIVLGIVSCATGFGGIIGGVLLSAGVESLIGGYTNELSGGDFDVGCIGGMISGALCGTGAGLGGLAFQAATESANLACIGYLMFGSFLSFAGGFSGSFIGSMYINNHDHNSVTNKLDINELLLKSTIMGLFNIVGGSAALSSK